jgi:hypothetical protein
MSLPILPIPLIAIRIIFRLSRKYPSHHILLKQFPDLFLWITTNSRVHPGALHDSASRGGEPAKARGHV